LHADQLEATTVRTVLDVALFWDPVLTEATTTIIALVTALALRSQAGLPRWLGVNGAVVLVEQVIETITIYGYRQTLIDKRAQQSHVCTRGRDPARLAGRTPKGGSSKVTKE
jgi:hypothetical protein